MRRDVAKLVVQAALIAAGNETTADLIAQCKKLGIGGRASFGDVSVGKKMGKSTYVHRDYESMFPGAEPAAGRLPRDFDYTVVKHDADSGCFSFIECADFDTAPEPTVGKSARVCGSEVTWRSPGKDPQIYHHKWTMVTDDYEGFDVVESMRRSIAWKSIVGKDAALSSRIGKKSVWEKEVVPKLEASAEVPYEGNPLVYDKWEQPFGPGDNWEYYQDLDSPPDEDD